MRGKLTSRVLAALLAVVMVVGLLPMTALAARVIDDDAPMAETAMGEEAVAVPVRAPSKAAEVAAAEMAEAPAGTRHYFAKAAAGANPWTIISDGTGLPNTLSYHTSGSDFSNDLTELGDTENRSYRIFAASTGAPNNGFLNTTEDGTIRVATQGGGYNGSNTNTGAVLVKLEAQSNGAYRISFQRNGKYYLTADTKTYNGAECAVFSPDKADAVPYFVEYDGGFRIYCVGPYTVSFTGEGAADIADVEAMYGQKLALPTPTREGYTFQGWFNGEEEFTAETEVTADVTLTAKWELQKPARAEGERQYELVTANELESGYYVLRSWPKGGQSAPVATIRRAANASAVSECKDITIGDGTLNLAGGHDDEHVWLVVKTAEGYVIQSMSEGNGYLNHAASTNSGTNIPISDTPATFQITYGAKDGPNGADVENAFVISWDNNGTPRYINHSGSVWHGWDVWGIGIAFYKEVSKTATTEPDPEEPGKEAPPVEPEAAVEYRLAEGTLAEGVYAIVGSTAEAGKTPRSMHYWTDDRTVLDQCSSEAAAGAETVSFSDVATNHLWNVTRTAEGKYTFAAVAAEGYYITGGAGTLSRGTTATEFTVVARSDGGHDLSWVSDGTTYYMAWASGSRWYGATDQYRINLYKEGNAPFVMAQTKFSGTSDKPMDRLHILNQNDDVDTDYRIPALTTLDNGWIVAACDIRWSSTADSPNNLDTIVSVSKDGGVSWEWEVVNYFSDFAPINGSKKTGSASFIDPAVVQSEEDGSIYLLVDAQAPYVNGGKIGNGFDDQGRLKISKSPVNGSYSMDNDHDNDLRGYTFDYYVDINNAEAGANYTVDGETVKLWPICANDDDQATGYYVDAFFNTYYDYGEGGMRAVIAQQHDSTAYIHNNIFYTQSEWKVFPTAFLMLRKATVNETTGKLDWGEPMLISSQIKYDTEHFIGVCPGRGITTTVNGKERILFALYDSSTGAEKASVIYSDDGGKTWHRGARVENGETSKNSESQIVELHNADGTPFLRMFSRNSNNTEYVSYADSFDNGLTWTTTKFDRELPNGHETMMSFIGLEGFLVSPEGDVYDDLVLASYPRGDKSDSHGNRRTDGMVRIGYYDAEKEAMVWLNDKDDVRYPYKFTYSCLTQLRDGDGFTDRFALLYEDERTWASDHGMEMGFDTFTSADLLGEGWMLVQAKPDDDHPIITVEPIAEQTYTGEPVEPAVTVKKNGEVMTEGYTVEYSNNTEAGEATVTVTVGEIVVETTFRIVKPDEYTVGAIADRVYTGEALKPTVVVRKNGAILTMGYTLEYKNNVNVGEATVDVVVGGKVVATGTFRIVEDTAGDNTGDPDDGPGNTPSDTPSTPTRRPASVEEDLDDLDVPLAQLPMTFEDVKADDWFYEAAEFVFAQDMMLGVSATEFRPAMNTTRGMVVTILHRMEQEPEADPANFTDVASTAWYGSAVAWGVQSAVVQGADDGDFHPMDAVTREQLAAFLYRFAEYRGYDVSARGELSGYADSAVVSSWAKDAMSWAVGVGLITGKDGNVLAPLSAATRGELATILTRFCKTVAEEK